MKPQKARGNQRQSEAIRGHQLLVIQRPTETIRCNQAAPQTKSDAIRRNQAQSGSNQAQSDAISMPGALCFRVFVFWAGRKACVLCFCVLGWHNGPVFCVFVFWGSCRVNSTDDIVPGAGRYVRVHSTAPAAASSAALVAAASPCLPHEQRSHEHSVHRSSPLLHVLVTSPT